MSRALIARKLKGLDDAVDVSIVEPELGPRGWRFADGRALADVYVAADPHYTGRATVPVLWDEKEQTIVNNESADIVRMFNASFAGLARGGPDLYPEALRPEIDALEEDVYRRLNNGVYRAGFVTTQQAYEGAVQDVFAMLDALEERLGDREYLVGGALTEADIRVFVTLVRFDLAYHDLSSATSAAWRTTRSSQPICAGFSPCRRSATRRTRSTSSAATTRSPRSTRTGSSRSAPSIRSASRPIANAIPTSSGVVAPAGIGQMRSHV